MTDTILFEGLPAANQTFIGCVTLNQPQWLNGLSLEMASAFLEQLESWRRDDAVRLIVMRGQGEKAFCAGGDLQSFYREFKAGNKSWASGQYLREFFRIEYMLDYTLHTFNKPVVCWANGYVMGGGAGLMMGASHRVATPSTRFAMPEISIGVVPDVGASWFLNRLPEPVGRFLGMTGVSIGASDCQYLGLTQYLSPASGWDPLLRALQGVAWSEQRRENDHKLDELLRTFAPLPSPAPGELQLAWERVRQCCGSPHFETLYANLSALAHSDNAWLSQAGQRVLQGSPGSVRLTFETLMRARHASLADAFRMEYIVALHCAFHPDLQEGIRALLIDKDKSPNWQPATVSQASEQWAQAFFEPLWPAGESHPLADIEQLARL